MSIFGIGTDIAHIPRFVRLLSDPAIGRRLQHKMLHPLELQQLDHIQIAAAVNVDRRVAEYVASRWAVKEAVTKAFGARLLFPDICLHSPTAAARAAQHAHPASHTSAALKPQLQLRRAAANDPRPSLHFDGQCASLMAAAGVSADSSHVSLSHDGEYAIAFVTLVSQRSLP